MLKKNKKYQKSKYLVKSLKKGGKDNRLRKTKGRKALKIRSNKLINSKSLNGGAQNEGSVDINEIMRQITLGARNSNSPLHYLNNLSIGRIRTWVKKNTLKRTDDDINDAVLAWINNKQQALQRYGPIEFWDTSQVTDMSRLFNDEIDFNDDISRWDTSNVTNMSDMFHYTSSFNQRLNTREITGIFGNTYTAWNVSKVTNMTRMFMDAHNFNNGDQHGESNYPLRWNVDEVIDMKSMFNTAGAFNQYIGDWNVSQVRDMRNMFANAGTFNNGGRTFTWIFNDDVKRKGMFFNAGNFTQEASIPVIDEHDESKIYHDYDGQADTEILDNNYSI